MTIGKTEEGRDILVAFVSSEENIRNLEANRQNLRRLADPRNLTATEARDLIARTRPHYQITAGLHSTEVSPPEMVMELAYRLAASDEPCIVKIRQQVVVSFAPPTVSSAAGLPRGRVVHSASAISCSTPCSSTTTWVTRLTRLNLVIWSSGHCRNDQIHGSLPR